MLGYSSVAVLSTEPPSAVLADQVKSFDWAQRQAIFKDKVSQAALADVKRKIYALIGRP